MLFLQDNILSSSFSEGAGLDSIPKSPVVPDSLRTFTQTIIREVQADPHTFWQTTGESIMRFGMKVLLAIVIYMVGAWIIRYIKRLITRIFERRQTERTLATFISSLVSITLTVMLILATIGTLGVDTTSFAALLTAGGMAIGMALSGTVQNFAGGIMLLVFRPFKSGDYICTQGVEGFVVEVSIVSTKILTYSNRLVILPNGNLFTSTIENLSAQGALRLEWQVSVDYGVDAVACKEAILRILTSDERILSADSKIERPKSRVTVDNHDIAVNLAPVVVLDTLNSNDITFLARAWVKTKDYWPVKYAMQERFYTELPPQGFTFAYPHMDVHITHPVEMVNAPSLKK